MRTQSADLEILLAVVDTGGFSAAAHSLDIQVARVSRAVSKIERQLGVTILNRTTRRIDLSEEGRQFVEAVRKGLIQLQLAEADIISRGELPKGCLRVDAASPFVFHQLVPLVQPFHQAYPDIELQLTSNEGFVDLLAKKTDVAIRIGTLSDSTLYARSLGKSPLYIVAAPGYLAKHGLPRKSSELSGHHILGFSTPKALNDWPLKYFNGVSPTLTSSNGEALRQLALMGNGIACLSGFMVKKDIAQGRLVALLQSEIISHPSREQISAVYYKSSAVAKRIAVFIEFIASKLTL